MKNIVRRILTLALATVMALGMLQATAAGAEAEYPAVIGSGTKELDEANVKISPIVKIEDKSKTTDPYAPVMDAYSEIISQGGNQVKATDLLTMEQADMLATNLSLVTRTDTNTLVNTYLTENLGVASKTAHKDASMFKSAIYVPASKLAQILLVVLGFNKEDIADVNWSQPALAARSKLFDGIPKANEGKAIKLNENVTVGEGLIMYDNALKYTKTTGGPTQQYKVNGVDIVIGQDRILDGDQITLLHKIDIDGIESASWFLTNYDGSEAHAVVLEDGNLKLTAKGTGTVAVRLTGRSKGGVNFMTSVNLDVRNVVIYDLSDGSGRGHGLRKGYGAFSQWYDPYDDSRPGTP